MLEFVLGLIVMIQEAMDRSGCMGWGIKVPEAGSSIASADCTKVLFKSSPDLYLVSQCTGDPFVSAGYQMGRNTTSGKDWESQDGGM